MNTDHPDNEDGIFQGEWSPTGGVPTGRGVASSAAALVLVLALVIAAGAGLRFFRLGQKSLWVDEAISCVLASTGHDPVELPPLYFRLLGLTYGVFGIGLIVISDDLPELLAICHRILVMKEGRLTENIVGGSVDEHELTRRLAS